MALFEWDEKYTVKIERFDEAHKKLIQLMNEVYRVIKSKKNDGQTESILNELYDYTKTHFNDEINMMEKYNYPDVEEHREEHNEFIRELDNIKQMIGRQSNLLNVQLLNFIKDWLINHIMKSDAKYGQFFSDIGLK